MSKTYRKPLLFLISPGGVCLLLGLCYFIWLGWPYPDAMAAWLQAFGSIVMLAIAIAIPRMERASNTQERRVQKRSEELEYIWRSAEIARTASDALITTSNWLGDYAGRLDVATSCRSVGELLATIQTVDLFKVADQQIASSILVVRHNLSLALGDLEALMKVPNIKDAVERNHYVRGVKSASDHSYEAVRRINLRLHELAESPGFN